MRRVKWKCRVLGTILTDRQRSALFDLPTDEASLLKHYTLADDGLEQTRARRSTENRIGFALQLCALRYPGRLLSHGEVVPETVLRSIGAQLGIGGDALFTYAARRQTRQEHLEARHAALPTVTVTRFPNIRRARSIVAALVLCSGFNMRRTSLSPTSRSRARRRCEIPASRHAS